MSTKPTTGELKPTSIGVNYYCIDCNTIYPPVGSVAASVLGLAMCNGHPINVCPWCRPDSRPWMNGRGV